MAGIDGARQPAGLLNVCINAGFIFVSDPGLYWFLDSKPCSRDMWKSRLLPGVGFAVLRYRRTRIGLAAGQGREMA
jgi:hypothetical protein